MIYKDILISWEQKEIGALQRKKSESEKYGKRPHVRKGQLLVESEINNRTSRRDLLQDFRQKRLPNRDAFFAAIFSPTFSQTTMCLL